MDLMEKFLKDRKNVKAYRQIEYHDSDLEPYLYIKDPRLLAGFAGYLKFQCLKQSVCNKVFYRGQNKNFKIIPSLFRDVDGIIADNARIQLRQKAYEELVQKIPTLYNAYRFEREDINPILQHYGIRTHWIDLVDNIYIAIWFATRKLTLNEDGLAYFVKSCEEFGWVYFIAMNDELEYYDLRENHSSLSLRLHVQHGISATRRNNDWNVNNRHLDNFVIARTKIPNDEIWDLNNLIFSTKYLFPNEDLDNTYKYLRKPKFHQVLNEIVEKYELKENEIGSILEYAK